MSRLAAAVILALAMTLGGGILASAHAAPPTVTPSPGYDARLQESRKAMSTTLTADPSAPVNPPVLRRHHTVRTHRR